MPTINATYNHKTYVRYSAGPVWTHQQSRFPPLRLTIGLFVTRPMINRIFRYFVFTGPDFRFPLRSAPASIKSILDHEDCCCQEFDNVFNLCLNTLMDYKTKLKQWAIRNTRFHDLYYNKGWTYRKIKEEDPDAKKLSVQRVQQIVSKKVR